MQISIIANLTDEQCEALATVKGWVKPQQAVTTIVNPETFEESQVIETVGNTQTAGGYVRDWYTGYISRDIANEFIRIADAKQQAEWDKQDAMIRESVVNSITSSIKK